MTPRFKKILVAMSGGVDSAVAALLLVRDGVDCAAATMRLFDPPSASDDTLDPTQAARAVAKKIGIPFQVFNLEEDFRRHVVAPFCADYQNGRTPNPCLLCNYHLKFEILQKFAQQQGFDGIATGHYAQIEQQNGAFRLRRAVDLDKDQSYFLYKLTQQQLARSIFPLGSKKKSEVRDIARSVGLENANRAESQDICFIPDGNVAAFVQSYQGNQESDVLNDGQAPCRFGMFIDTEGRQIARHEGIEHYTIGQRRGLGISGQNRQYVVKIDSKSGNITLGPNSALYSSELVAKDVNIIEQLGEKPLKTLVKIRSRAAFAPAIARMDGNALHITFNAPQRAITAGQSAVVYDESGEYVLGGGVIER